MKTKIDQPAADKKNELYLLKGSFIDRNYENFTSMGRWVLRF